MNVYGVKKKIAQESGNNAAVSDMLKSPFRFILISGSYQPFYFRNELIIRATLSSHCARLFPRKRTLLFPQ